VYVRVAKDDTLTFGVSGMLWRDAMVMYDHQTDSKWSQISGNAILGERIGQQLQTYYAIQTSWNAWVDANPGTYVLEKQVLSQSAYSDYEKDPRKMGIHGRRLARSQLPGKAKVVGFRLNEQPFAIPLDHLEKNSIIQIVPAAIPILIYTDGSGMGVTVWDRKMDGRVLQFDIPSETAHLASTLNDLTFDLIAGRSLDNSLQLERIHSTLAYWFGWHNFYPETKIIKP
jgi:hypothetical protein